MCNVCVLLSTYNGQLYLDKQLTSISSQQFKGNIKVLVRDDGSFDNTLKILEEWSDNLDITMIKGENVGPMASFLDLTRQAPPADFYAFCDQDDTWHPEKIASGVEQLLTMPPNKANLYFSNAELVDDQLKTYNELFHKSTPNYTLVGSMVCNPALGCTIMFNSILMNIVKKVHPVHASMHDKFLLLTAILLGNVTYDHSPRIKYRQHSLNVCGREGNFKKRVKQTIKLWFGSQDITLEKQARELLDFYNEEITDEHKKKLKLFANYRNSVIQKIKLLLCRDIITTHHKANTSFVLRTLLNLA